MIPEPSRLPETPTLPIKNLWQFLEEVRKLFDNIVYHWDQILFEEEFRPRLKAAWAELRQRIPTWQEEVRRQEVVVSPRPDEDALDMAGLHGAQRDLKLEGLTSAWNRFKSRGTVRLLRNVLGWINAILGSMAQAIPGVEALKELKEAIEKLIAEDDS